MKKLRLVSFIILCVVSMHAQEIVGEMVLIPEGEYTMGKDSDKASNYSPAHLVKVDSFFMDKTEVTNGQYLRFCKETGNKLPEFWDEKVFRNGSDFLNFPVVGVSWSDAMKYAEWAGKRLPTEAEWEYAARGGLKECNFPEGNEWEVPRRRNEPDSGWKNLIVEVGAFSPNGFGLYDMGGNVWEWVFDFFDAEYYQISPKDNPKGPKKSPFRVIRGGSWHSGAMCKRVYFRKGLSPGWVDFAVGFRCVKDL